MCNGGGATTVSSLGHRYQTLIWTSATDVTGVGAVYETVTNSGAVTVNAAATAVAGSSAYASATATGVLPGRGWFVVVPERLQHRHDRGLCQRQRIGNGCLCRCLCDGCRAMRRRHQRLHDHVQWRDDHRQRGGERVGHLRDCCGFGRGLPRFGHRRWYAQCEHRERRDDERQRDGHCSGDGVRSCGRHLAGECADRRRGQRAQRIRHEQRRAERGGFGERWLRTATQPRPASARTVASTT